MSIKSIKASFLKKKKEFLEMPLAEWLENLKEARFEEGIPDIESIEDFLIKFKEDHDEE